MGLKLSDRKTWLCIGLFLYQSLIDVNIISIENRYRETSSGISDFLTAEVFNKPVIFLVLYIFHRALVHGIIIRFFTGSKKLVKYYVLLDVSLFFLLAVIVVLLNIQHQYSGLYTILGSYFLKLLNTPLLLLFFLPLWYLMEAERGRKNTRVES